MANFAVIGVGGFVAPRHLQAIGQTGNRLLAATDRSDSVGVLDRYSFDVKFFREIERFDRFLEKSRRGPEESRVHYVSICSPNYLHDAHVRLAMRVGADAICEKPLVINPWNLDALQELESETGRRVWTILQLRVHPALLKLKETLASQPGRRRKVRLTYITGRGGWYHVSWKGSDEESGGLMANIGIHFFDLLMWLFGPAERYEVHMREKTRCAGLLVLKDADVEWFLSVDVKDLPFEAKPGSKSTYRSITMNDEEIEFTEGFTDLHTRVYELTLAGQGFGIDDSRPSIDLVYRLRHAPLVRPTAGVHPLVEGKRSEVTVG